MSHDLCRAWAQQKAFEGMCCSIWLESLLRLRQSKFQLFPCGSKAVSHMYIIWPAWSWSSYECCDACSPEFMNLQVHLALSIWLWYYTISSCSWHCSSLQHLRKGIARTSEMLEFPCVAAIAKSLAKSWGLQRARMPYKAPLWAACACHSTHSTSLDISAEVQLELIICLCCQGNATKEILRLFLGSFSLSYTHTFERDASVGTVD